MAVSIKKKIIYAGLNGYLDEIPLDKITQFNIKENFNHDPNFPLEETENTYKHDWLGYIASILGPLALGFEVYHVYEKKSGESLSYIWLCLSLVVSALWLSHSAINNINPGVISSSFYICLTILMISIKYKYSLKKGRKKTSYKE